MTGQTDHDVLITLNAKFDSFLERYEDDTASVQKDMLSLRTELSKFATRVSVNSLAYDERLRIVENKAIKCESDNQNMKTDIDDLQKKSNILDVILGVFTFIGSAIGILLGNK